MARPALDPRRIPLPRRRTLARYALIAALLTLAVGALYATPGSKECNPNVTVAPSRASAGPEPSETPLPGSTDADQPPAVPGGLAGISVRVADPAIVAVLRAGMRVDLHAGTPDHTVTDAMVLTALPGDSFDEPGAAALFVAVPPPTAAHVSSLPVGVQFRVIVRSP